MQGATWLGPFLVCIGLVFLSKKKKKECAEVHILIWVVGIYFYVTFVKD